MKKLILLFIFICFAFLFKAQPIYLMSSTSTVNLTCPSTSLFYDSGGSAGNYANNENFTKTFSVAPGNCLQVSFNSAFQTESGFDFFKVFDGPTGASPLLGTYQGVLGPGIIQSSGTSLTFSFTSDGSVNYAGWDATVTCVSACSGTPAGGVAAISGSPCAATGSVGLLVNGSAAACGLIYQWQSGPSSAGPWTNVPGATSSVLTVSINAANYYRRLTNCGANSGPSAAIAAAAVGVTCTPIYTPSSIPFLWLGYPGTIPGITDDVLFNSIAMFGFPVCYGGASYWGGYIASNQAFVFDAVPCVPNILSSTYAAPGVGTGWQITIPAPNTTEIPRNAILAPWHDAYPPAGGVISYTTTGVAPNRIFLATFDHIAMFSCTTLSCSSQIRIYETTNVIEIHLYNKPICATWNSGMAVLGLQNFNGTVYTGPVNSTLHNAGTTAAPYTWSVSGASPVAYRFTPNACAGGAGGSCLTLPIVLKAFYGERKEKVNHLYWETSQENSVQIFKIERSIDGITFETVGSVLPNNSPSKYSYDDYNSREGVINYYRVSIEDKNGGVEKTYIYPLGGLASQDMLTVLSVHPNPSNSNYKVNIESKITSKVTFKIANSLGRTVKIINHDLFPGLNDFEINAEDLSQGVYILSLENNMNEVISKIKLIKN